LKYLFNLLVLLLLLSFSANATTIYVKKSATGSNNGTSWTNAYTDLQNALDAASVNDQIWVAAGTYLPTASPDGTTDNRNKAFHLATDMKIYGGFDGTETQLSARNAATNITILSGDFNGNDIVTGNGSTLSITNNRENAYHVMITANLTVAAVIDGFTIKGGNANGSGNISYQSKKYYDNAGGGMDNISSDLTITHTTFLHNKADLGGGMVNDSSDPIITHTTFFYNTARYGGGMSNYFSSSPTITNATFLYNTAEYGGGMFSHSSSPIITNTTFSYNMANSYGGGMGNYSSSPTITNTIFSYNTASDFGGGMYNNNSSNPIIKNSIFWENLKNGSNFGSGADIEDVSSSSPIVSYCLTQANSDYSSGTGIINNQDPLFVDAVNGDFSLQNCSPAINAGTTVSHTTDILGNPRVGIVDMGAYEYQDILSIYVNINATGTNDGSSWTNAYTDLQNAIDNQCGGFDIWVAAGTYLPTASPDGTTDNRNNTFHLATNMKIYGGFDGTETQLSARNAVTNITILSGDLSGNDIVTGSGSTLSITNNTENAYHVMITANLTAAAVIDGFTIKGGNANGSGSIFYRSQTLYKNGGGGMYNSSSSPMITGITFTNNNASYGSGMLNYSSSPIITNTTFSYNTASDFGGGMYNNNSSSPIITNTTFSYNTANLGGGGMYNFSSSPIITNTTFSHNTASNFDGFGGGGMYNTYSSSPIIMNTIFWENLKDGLNSVSGADIANISSSPTVSYCLTQENSVYDGVNNNGTGIINNQDPLFVDAANGDFSLKGCSPAINAGTATNAPTTDILENPRVGIVDMGAYEYQASNIYVDITATGNNDGSSWTNAYTDLQNAIDNQCGGFDIWVAAETYLPTDAPDGTTSTGFTNRNNAFHLATDMKIYGGFDGTETQLSARNAATNITILSGDFNNNDGVTGSGSTLSITNNTENAYHVIITAKLSVAAVIDGFTIKGGNADGNGDIAYQSKSYLRYDGGGMANISSSPTITNTTFSYNTASISGGGMANDYSSSPTITNTTFLHNTANFGGGMENTSSSPTITNTTFSYNTANFGGGMENFSSSSPTITNTTFSYNTAGDDGGGMYNDNSSSPTITNTIFWENLKGSLNNVPGADIKDVSSSSPTVSYCLTQTYSSGTGIINNQNPLFVDAANGDFSLQGCSPAINTGTARMHRLQIYWETFV
jgi:virulence-associated protein VapD